MPPINTNSGLVSIGFDESYGGMACLGEMGIILCNTSSTIEVNLNHTARSTTNANASDELALSMLILLALYGAFMFLLATPICRCLLGLDEESESEDLEAEDSTFDTSKRKQEIKEGLVVKKVLNHNLSHTFPPPNVGEEPDLTGISANETAGCSMLQGQTQRKNAIGPCSICLEPFTVGQDVSWSRNMKCNHAYHSDCITEWLLKHTKCPCCREKYVGDFKEVNTRRVPKDRIKVSVFNLRGIEGLFARGDIRSSSEFCVLHGLTDPVRVNGPAPEQSPQACGINNIRKIGDRWSQSTDQCVPQDTDLETGLRRMYPRGT